jgi:WD40 repeat protein
VWDVAARRTTAVLKGHTGAIIEVAFSRDGSTLAVNTSEDGSIRLWDIRTAQLRATLTDAVKNGTQSPHVTLSPNGHALATSDRDGVRVWNTDADDVATRICRLSTEHHWAQTLPDQPMKDLCPA